MGTLNFTVGGYARTRGAGSSSIMNSDIATSDAFTTSTSAANVEDGSGDITLATGQVFECTPDEAMWVSFGGVAATVGTGFYLTEGVTRWFECETPGAVSVIDVA